VSFRAVILGTIGAMLIAGVGYLNDQVLRLNFLVGNHFPISVFGMLILGMIVINPLLFRWRFRSAEIAVALALVLIACSVPGSSLMRVFTPSLVMPIHYNTINPGWRKNDVLSYVPPAMLPGRGDRDAAGVADFLSGREQNGVPIGLADVPWEAWDDPLMTWIPLVILAGICAISMSLIVHHQWARRERLRYPIADFAASVTTLDPGRSTPKILRSKVFWIGLGVTFCIHLINGTHAWFPNSISIPLEFEVPLWQKYPLLAETPTAERLLRPIFYPTFVAFAYFVASDISFTLGTCQVLFVLLAASLLTAGVDISQAHFRGGPFMWGRFGSYLMIALILAYTGRDYYRQVFRHALFVGRRGDLGPAGKVERSVVWAGRCLILAAGGMIVTVALLGLAWPLAVLAVAMLLLIYLVMARINAEAGLFHCEPLWEPIAVLIGLFGFHALGLEGLAILGLFTAVLIIDPRECLAPFVVNGLKICDQAKVATGRVAWTGVVVLLLAIAVAVPVVLWANYNFGVQTADKWSTYHVPTDAFSVVERAATDLRTAGRLESSERLSGIERLINISPDHRFFWAFAAGALGVLVLSALRRRFPWWPLHPIMFLVAGTWPIEQFSHSFLLGWFIKTVVTKLGGANRYRKGKTFMIGIVAGDLLGGLVFMGVGAIYYWVTGLLPIKHHVFPD